MNLNLSQIAEEISLKREEVIDRLSKFAATDLLFFWGQEKDLIVKQQEIWQPILDWAGEKLETKFEVSYDVANLPGTCAIAQSRIQSFLKNLSDKEMAGFYAAALNTKSILVAAALVKKQISADEASRAAFLEEDFQASTWGEDDEFSKRKQEIVEELKQVEDFLK